MDPTVRTLAASAVAFAAVAMASATSTAAPRVSGAWNLVETRQRMADGSTRPDPDLGPTRQAI